MREMEMREAIKLNVMFFNVEESYAENEEKRIHQGGHSVTDQFATGYLDFSGFNKHT